MTDVIAAYARYTDRAHAELAEAVPELRQNLIIGETYVEAFGFACEAVIRALIQCQVVSPVVFIYHPHNEGSDDPMDAFGSLGWKSA